MPTPHWSHSRVATGVKKGKTPPSSIWGYPLIKPTKAPQRQPAPEAISPAALDGILKDFVRAAQWAQEIGIEAVELHGAHGYLLHEFLSPLSNVRTDEYGGSLENRMRFPLAIFDAVRAAVPVTVPVGFRISATDWVDGGWDLAQSLVFGKALRSRGGDFIDVSSGGISPRQQIPLAPGYQVAMADQIRRETGLPTVAVGLITEPEQADAIIANGQADLVALARGMLFDPHWPWHAAAKLGAQVEAPHQYWRSQPRGMTTLFGDVHVGQR